LKAWRGGCVVAESIGSGGCGGCGGYFGLVKFQNQETVFVI
jgi:hypothetical protein